MSNLYYFKLLNGEEIIAELISIDSSNSVEINVPLKIHYIHKDDTQIHKVGILLNEWIFQVTAANRYTIDKCQIVVYSPASEIIHNIYYKTLESISNRDIKHTIKEGYAHSDDELIQSIKDFADEIQNDGTDDEDNIEYDLPYKKKGVH